LKNRTFTFLGTGTSQGIPVIGCECSVCLSTSPRDKRLRTSGLIRWGGTHIGIDCGPDFRQQMLAVNINHLNAILITHGHQDHVAGLDEVRPFNFMSRSAMPLYAESEVAEDLKSRFGYIFSANKYPGSPNIVFRAVSPKQSFEVGPCQVKPIRVYHGQLPIMGYRFDSLAYLTDISAIKAPDWEDLEDLEVLIVNALHRKSHHAHLNLAQAIDLSQQIGAKTTYFVHMSHHMGLHAEVSLELPTGIQLAYDGLTIEF
jgi:phosphoribosyl 1,2-cyclic phosphate phosphodiesterase